MKPSIALVTLILLSAGSAVGAVFIEKDQPIQWFNDATFAQTPDQAISQISDLGNVAAEILPGTSASTSKCVVFPEPTFVCFGPEGPASYLASYSASGSGVDADGDAAAGGDLASATLRAGSAGSAVPGFTPLLYNIATIDRQRLYFKVEGASGTMSSPLAASASSFTFFDPGESALLGQTETILVRPNEEYWVSLEAQATISLPGGVSSNPRDYAGLDVEATAWADPVFALNPDFAQANPDIASVLTIVRVNNVPEPTALSPLLVGLVSLVIYARHPRHGRTRQARHRP